MDSTTMLYDFRDQIALALNFSYGSNHNALERECARWHCQKLGIELVEIDLDFMSRHFESSLLQGADAIPEGDYDDQNMRSTVVPFRNGIMLSIAAGLAESRGLDSVMLANHAGDHAIYPDCRPQFAQAMAQAIAAGTYAPVRLLTPYVHMTKGEIACRGRELGVDYRHTYSCYKGTVPPCGVCGTCRERAQALAQAGFPPEQTSDSGK